MINTNNLVNNSDERLANIELKVKTLDDVEIKIIDGIEVVMDKTTEASLWNQLYSPEAQTKIYNYQIQQQSMVMESMISRLKSNIVKIDEGLVNYNKGQLKSVLNEEIKLPVILNDILPKRTMMNGYSLDELFDSDPIKREEAQNAYIESCSRKAMEKKDPKAPENKYRSPVVPWGVQKISAKEYRI